LITPAVQLVITRNRACTEQWAEQDRVREQVRQWLEDTNTQQTAEMQTPGDQRITTGKEVLTEVTEPSSSGVDPDISDLAGIQVTMMLEQFVERQAQRRQDRLGEPWNGSV
jgi:K+-transporting ATPase c subunit